MKVLTIILSLILLTSCNTIKKEVNNSKTPTSSLSCPDDGICTIEYIKEKRLVIKKDDLNSIYYQTVDDKDFSIIKYTYTKNKEPDIQDNSYVEEIIFELKNTTNSIELINSNLQNTKMLFGRHCYCKGQAGYFKVMEGELFLNREKENLTIDLNFKISEVPHIIKFIKTSIK